MSTAKTWYGNPRAKFSEKQMTEAMLADGATDARIWLNGRRGQSVVNALGTARDRILRCPRGMVALGGSKKEIDEAMDFIESKGGIVLDFTNGLRSDTPAGARKMYAAALSSINQEQRGLNKRKSRQGGNTRAAILEGDRLAGDLAEPIWKNVKRFATDADACKHMNEIKKPTDGVSTGWNPQLARRHFGPSGRPRGNRAWQSTPKVVTKRKRK